MAKKSRQARKRRSKARPQITTTAPVAAVKEKSTPPRSEVVDFSQEYRYVIADLKRIGILAAAMMGLLVVLSFIIR